MVIDWPLLIFFDEGSLNYGGLAFEVREVPADKSRDWHLESTIHRRLFQRRRRERMN